MRCVRCGSVLDDDAVFCYKCGDFVMREEEPGPFEIERAGKRRRGSASHRGFIIKLVIWVTVAAAGVAAAILGYDWIAGQWAENTESGTLRRFDWEMTLPQPNVFERL